MEQQLQELGLLEPLEEHLFHPLDLCPNYT